MKLIVCVDKNNGILESDDWKIKSPEISGTILDVCNGGILWMKPSTARLFDCDTNFNINISEDCICEATQGEYCLSEAGNLQLFEKWIEQLILFRFNSGYSLDKKLDIPLNEHGWICSKSLNIPNKDLTLTFWERPETVHSSI